jgi:hypothetical protein
MWEISKGGSHRFIKLGVSTPLLPFPRGGDWNKREIEL